MSKSVRRLLWSPYVARLARATAELRRADPRVRGTGVLTAREVTFVLARRVVPKPVRRLLKAMVATGRRVRIALGAPPRESWKRRDVVEQHRALVREQLCEPERVPPFRTFLQAMRTLLRMVPLPEPVRFLDFGCGLGHYGELLERHFPNRFDYTGCDYAEEMIAAARAEWPGRRFLVNDLLRNELDLAEFDVLFASALIDVLEDYEEGLRVLLASPATVVFLHRQQLTDDASRAEPHAGYPGQLTYRSYVNLDDLLHLATEYGRELAAKFHVGGDVHSFLLVRRERR